MLTITPSEVHISRLNARNEFHGDDQLRACDVTVRITVADDAQGILKGLKVPALYGVLWNESGIPILGDVETKLRHKVHNVKAEFGIGPDEVVTLDNADLKGLKLEALPSFGLAITGKVQSLVSGDDFDTLWQAWQEGGASITITERQTDLEGMGEGGS